MVDNVLKCTGYFELAHLCEKNFGKNDFREPGSWTKLNINIKSMQHRKSNKINNTELVSLWLIAINILNNAGMVAGHT